MLKGQKYVKLKQVVPRTEEFLGVERCQGKTMKNNSPRLSIVLLRRPRLAKIKDSKDSRSLQKNPAM